MHKESFLHEKSLLHENKYNIENTLNYKLLKQLKIKIKYAIDCG